MFDWNKGLAPREKRERFAVRRKLYSSKVSFTVGSNVPALALSFLPEVLRQIARRLKETFRTEDAVGRYGGEEFVALAVGCNGPDAIGLAERYRQAVSSEPFTIGTELLDVTTSVGVVTGTAADGVLELVRAADEALYCAKASGRNKVMAAKALATP